MVEWDSKERGVPLGANQGLRGYYIGCSACRRWITIEFAIALRRFGASTYTGDLAQRLRCNECGARRGYVMAWAASNGP
jgi:hypothetical protein